MSIVYNRNKVGAHGIKLERTDHLEYEERLRKIKEAMSNDPVNIFPNDGKPLVQTAFEIYQKIMDGEIHLPPTNAKS